MCLGIPGKVIETYHEHDVLMGKVDFGGIARRVCLEHVADVTPGQYVLVHVGFALSRIDEEEAQRVFEFLASMNQLDEIQTPEPLDGVPLHPPESPPSQAGATSANETSPTHEKAGVP